MEPLARIPDGVADDQAAAMPIPAVTALRTVELLEVIVSNRPLVPPSDLERHCRSDKAELHFRRRANCPW